MSDDKNEQFNPASFERAAVVLCLSCGISWEPDERAFTAHFTGQRMLCWKCKGDTGSLWDAILNMLVEWFVFGHSLVFAGARELHIRETLRHEEVKEIDLTKHGVPEGAEVLHLNFTPVGRSAMATMRHGNSPELGPIGPKFIVSGRMLGESVAGNEGWLGISAIWHTDRYDDTVVRHLVHAAREYHRGRFGGVIVPANIAAEAALARRSPGDRRLAERFELYAAGVELANGFGELTDPVEQRQRFESEMAEKQRIHGERYPLDEELLAALSLMPEASGVALGFDRLVMLATDARRIEEVMWTPPPPPANGW